MKTKAAFTYGQQDIRFGELELPEMEPGGALLQVAICGICGSDSRMFFTGLTPRYKQPIVLGHEFSGHIVKLGEAQTGFQVGDLVTIAPIIPCMRCDPCLEGLDNLCTTGAVVGCNDDGAMAEYYYVPARMVEAGGMVKVPPMVNARAAAMAELVGTCLNGWLQTGLEPGERVVIYGDGPIGLTFVQLARVMGASWVGVVGHRESRLKMAQQLGADDTRFSDGRDAAGFGGRIDRVVVATSNTAALDESFRVVKHGGSVLLFSGYVHGTTYNLDLNLAHYGQLHIDSAIDCTIRNFRQAVSLLPRLQMDKLVSRAYSLDQIETAFLATKDKSVNKIVLEP
jgi:L-iditol 2-dehydrogenase